MPIIKPSQSGEKSEPITKPNQNRPAKAEPSSSYALYSIADGKIMQHNMRISSHSIVHGMNSEHVNVYTELKKLIGSEIETEKMDQAGLTELAFLQVDASKDEQQTKSLIFAIGKYDGSIEVYYSYHKEQEELAHQSTIRKLFTLYNHQKLITCMKWNRHHTNRFGLNELDSESSSLLLASGSNDFNVIVVDIKAILKDILIFDKSGQLNERNFDLKFFNKFKYKLAGHKERITCLNWCISSQNKSLLASSSYDSTVQVTIKL